MFNKKEWAKKNKEKIAKQSRKHYLENKKHYDEYRKKWAREHIESRRETARKSVRKARIRALEMIARGKPVCGNCGCDDVRLLEINHINGGGFQEWKKCPGSRFIDKINRGDRKIDDLNILCRVCNAQDYLERKYGKLPYTIIYDMKIKI